jgi:hypothetical protein
LYFLSFCQNLLFLRSNPSEGYGFATTEAVFSMDAFMGTSDLKKKKIAFPYRGHRPTTYQKRMLKLRACVESTFHSELGIGLKHEVFGSKPPNRVICVMQEPKANQILKV